MHHPRNHFFTARARRINGTSRAERDADMGSPRLQHACPDCALRYPEPVTGRGCMDDDCPGHDRAAPDDA